MFYFLKIILFEISQKVSSTSIAIAIQCLNCIKIQQNTCLKTTQNFATPTVLNSGFLNSKQLIIQNGLGLSFDLSMNFHRQVLMESSNGMVG